jgi:hypothetical protein
MLVVALSLFTKASSRSRPFLLADGEFEVVGGLQAFANLPGIR